ncbi:sigma 54-interacting transcriptional regulator [candidate division KSB1 bacterium]
MSVSNLKKKILIISRDNDLCSRIKRLKMDFPVEFIIQQGTFESLRTLRRRDSNLVILEYDNLLISGKELIDLIHKSNSEIPVIAITDRLSHEEKKEIIKQGASDFLERPVDLGILKNLIKNLLFAEEHHYNVMSLREKIKETFGLENIIGDCDEMWKVFKSVSNIAESDVTVFINGESGTGKELLAKAIQKSSMRKNQKFITLNCAAIPENLLESELFGHEKGSFSGAVSKRIGKFELADNGTIFLDEIGEMSLFTQSKILRLLEEQEFERVGGNETIKVDVRIITATNKELEEEVAEKKFREDLFYRINVYPVKLPPLRERIDDIPLLIFHFLDVLSKKNNKEILGITPPAVERLKEYRWPGNIRELEHVLERAILNCPGKLLTLDQFKYLEGTGADINTDMSKVSTLSFEERFLNNVLPLNEVEKQAIENALLVNDWNISNTAKQLKIGRATLYRKIKEYNIEELN